MKLWPKALTVLLLLLTLQAERKMNAQTNATLPMASVPTTRILAIGRFAGGATREKIMPLMQKEVRETVRLYLSGKLDQWYTREDQSGVVFILNVNSVSDAKSLLERLPLGEAKLLEFDLIPLGPLSPLSLLLREDGVR